jgi:carboxymethylenebutenolidase
MSDVFIPVSGGTMGAFLALPEQTPAPGLLLIQEIFGVNSNMRQLAQEWAARGYAVLCPDLFWRQQPGVQLTDQSEAEWQQAFALYKGFDLALGMSDLANSAQWLRAQTFCGAKIGAIGFCLGGRLATLLATTTTIDASIAYYPVALDQHTTELSQIKRPLLIHVATLDKYAVPAMREKYEPLLKTNPLVDYHLYEGLDHAFARRGGQHYNEAGAELALSRSQEFLKRYVIS